VSQFGPVQTVRPTRPSVTRPGVTHPGVTRPIAALTLVAATIAGPVGAATAVAAPVPAAFAAARTADAAQGEATVTGDHLPVQIHVGAKHVDLPLWLKLDQPRKSVTVSLTRASGGDELASVTLTNSDPDTEFKGNLSFDTRGVKSWGAYRWTVTPENGKTYTVSAKVRSHSQLGLEAKRDDDEVTVSGSLRAYHSVLETYKPWKGRRVLVQRWDGADWVTVRALTTDKHGEVSATLKLDWTVGLRLTTKTSSKIWGADSNDEVL
jgi:hypothetical protein